MLPFTSIPDDDESQLTQSSESPSSPPSTFSSSSDGKPKPSSSFEPKFMSSKASPNKILSEITLFGFTADSKPQLHFTLSLPFASMPSTIPTPEISIFDPKFSLQNLTFLNSYQKSRNQHQAVSRTQKIQQVHRHEYSCNQDGLIFDVNYYFRKKFGKNSHSEAY